MTLDQWILAALGLFAAWGFYTGAIQQVSHMIGLAAAYLCAKPLAAIMGPGLAERMKWPPSLTGVGLTAVLIPVILIAAVLISRAILNALIPGDQRNTPDRFAGLFLGAAKAGALAWAALSVVLAFEKPLVRFYPSVKDSLAASQAAAFTEKHSLFAAELPPALERFHALAALRDDPKLAKKLSKDPLLKSLLNNPALKQALEKGETAALLEDSQLRSLLENPELAKKLDALSAR